ncbi:MAG TPA: hypothetical protein VFO93_12885 [Hymenobacter sp.]|uniref:hypothetical protein n=1 Tax=Hymenobacter sp. TaxID=1898978 RepID=UPI002D7EDC7D|nr:hypothetical protein [Hymenobacter sp.]HET9504430.1 hypothetical protein [Hymenobacter sp.]
MEGLTIRKKVTPRAKPSGRNVSEALSAGLLVLLLIAFIPLILLIVLFTIIWHKVFPEKPTTPTKPRPVVMHEVVNDLFPLRYHYVLGEDISEEVAAYFEEDEPLILYQPAAENPFFQGYFSDFKIEYPTGIFVQKVNFNDALTEAVSMPLCFFNYATQEAEELIDLKGYNLFAMERLNHFTITATVQDDSAEEFSATDFELEITLTDALYALPKAY